MITWNMMIDILKYLSRHFLIQSFDGKGSGSTFVKSETSDMIFLTPLRRKGYVQRHSAAILIMIIMTLANNSEAQSRYDLSLSSGVRFGGSFANAGYRSNSVVQDLDIASGVQYGGSFYFSKGNPYILESAVMYGFSINFQRSDLRFKPDSISGVPDSIRAKYEVDGNKLILGEVDVIYIHVGILYILGGDSSWDPHLKFGFGATVFNAPDGDLKESKFSLSFGGGLTKMLTEAFGIKIQLTGYLTTLPSDVYWVDNGGGAFRTLDNHYFFQGAFSGGLVFAF